MAEYIDTRINPADYIEVWEVEDTEHGKQLVMAVDDLKCLPPADVRPVKHGKWIKLDMHKGMEQYKCSICRSECYVPECMGEPMYGYCPNCGADMKGGKAMNQSDYQSRIAEAKKREESRSITLRELLIAIEPTETLPDEWETWDNFKNQSVFKIRLCFMAEEETWVEVYRNHVMLIPWYDCKVYGFNAGDEKFTLDVWLRYEDYVKQLLKRRQEAEP